MCQVVSYKRQYGYGEQNLQGNDKMAAEGNPKTTQQPPKLPQTAPTTLLRLKVYLATLGTNGRSQDWTFSQETPPTPSRAYQTPDSCRCLEPIRPWAKFIVLNVRWDLVVVWFCFFFQVFFFTQHAVVKARKAFFSESWETSKAIENHKVCTSWGPSGVRVVYNPKDRYRHARSNYAIQRNTALRNICFFVFFSGNVQEAKQHTAVNGNFFWSAGARDVRDRSRQSHSCEWQV